jgi:hypothetical protein
VILDRLMITKPPFVPDEVVEKYAEVLGSYGLSSVVGDRYAGEWVASNFLKHGITYRVSELDKSSIYGEVLPLFNCARVELLDIPLLMTELRLLERRTRPNGRGDLIDHPPRGTDDAANSVCGALLLASKLHRMGRSAEAGSRGLHINGLQYDPFELDAERARERVAMPQVDGWGRPI